MIRILNTHRLPAILILLCLLRGLTYAVVTPPWLAPDEPGHVAYALLLAEQGWPLHEDETTIVVEQRILVSLDHWQFWRRIHRPTPDPLPSSFLQDKDLIRQVGDEPPLYYVLPALAAALVSAPEVLLYIMRVYSALLLTLMVGVVALCARELFPGQTGLQAGAVALPALAPMVAYIGSSANNDVAAMLMSSAVFFVLLRIVRRGWTRRRAVGLVLLLILALFTKKTVFFLWLLAALVSFGAAWRWLGARPDKYRRRALVIVAALFLASAAGALLWRGNAASGWAGSSAQPAVLRSRQSHSGSFALRLPGSETGERQRAVQVLPFGSVRALRGASVRLTVWVRSPRGLQPARISVDDGRRVTSELFIASPTWTQYTLTHTVDADALSLWVRIAPRSQGIGTAPYDLLLDDITLVSPAGAGRQWLVNGGAEQGARRVEIWLKKWVGTRALTWRAWLDPAAYDRDSLARYGLYTLLTFAGFWGNMGWLTEPLPLGWYAFWAVFTAMVALGCLRPRGRDRLWSDLLRWQRSGLQMLALALLAVILQTMAPMIGQPWQPQGRYLFPALFPIAVFMVLGLQSWFPREHEHRWLGAWLAILLLFDQVAFWWRVAPL